MMRASGNSPRIALIASSPRDNLVQAEVGVPFLRDIPILGWAFKNVRDRHVVRRLVFAVQATVVDTPTDLAAEAIRRRLAFERHVERTRPLADQTTAPYALLVATFDTQPEAVAAAGELAGLAGTPRIVEWGDAGQRRFDVYLADLEQIADAGVPALALREKGFRPSLAVLPERMR